jgi:hypothetical protein
MVASASRIVGLLALLSAAGQALALAARLNEFKVREHTKAGAFCCFRVRAPPPTQNSLLLLLVFVFVCYCCII